METFYVVLAVMAVIGVVVGIILFARHLEQKRTEALGEFAGGLGLDFSPTQDEPLLTELQIFKLFNSGHSRQMKNVIKGVTDIATIAIFDYQYSTGSGKNRKTHSNTIVAMKSDDLTIPIFTMRPENLFDWFGSAIGLQDIDFDEHPEFSKSFVLKGENEEAIRKFFDIPLLDFFAEKKGITFEGAPGTFIYMHGGRKKPEELSNYLKEGYSVYAAFVERLSRS